MDKDIKERFIYLFGVILIFFPHQNAFEKETKTFNISSGEG